LVHLQWHLLRLEADTMMRKNNLFPKIEKILILGNRIFKTKKAQLRFGTVRMSFQLNLLNEEASQLYQLFLFPHADILHGVFLQ